MTELMSGKLDELEAEFERAAEALPYGEDGDPFTPEYRVMFANYEAEIAELLELPDAEIKRDAADRLAARLNVRVAAKPLA